MFGGDCMDTHNSSCQYMPRRVNTKWYSRMGIVVIICLLPITTSKPFPGPDEQLVRVWSAKLKGSDPPSLRKGDVSFHVVNYESGNPRQSTHMLASITTSSSLANTSLPSKHTLCSL